MEYTDVMKKLWYEDRHRRVLELPDYTGEEDFIHPVLEHPPWIIEKIGKGKVLSLRDIKIRILEDEKKGKEINPNLIWLGCLAAIHRGISK